MNLSGKTVLLTGASGGIGQAIARRLAAAGASVTLSGRRADVLEQLARELDADVIAADLADPVAVQQLASACADVDVARGQRRAARLRAAGEVRR